MPARRRKGLLGALTVAVLVVIMSATAQALFTATATTSGSLTTASLAPPTGLTVSGTSVATLSWKATTSTFAAGTRILRSTTSGGPYTAIGEVAGRTTTTYQDGTVIGGTTYYYVARAYVRSWTSPPSLEASLTVPATPFRQSATACQNNNSAMATSVTFATPPTAGDLLVAAVATHTSSTITPPLGWTLGPFNAPLSSPQQAIFSKISTGAADQTLTFGHALSFGAAGVQVYEFAGVPDTLSGTAGSNTGSGTVLSSGTGTVDEPYSLVFAAIVSGTSSTTLFNGWSAGSTGSSFHCTAAADYEATFGVAWMTTKATGAYEVQATADGGADWAGHVVAFGPIA